MMLASCAKERAEQDSVRNESHQEIQGTVVTIQAALGSQETAEQNPQKQNAATKTTQTDGNFSWTDGEQISVGTSDGEYVSFNLVSAANGTFTHTFPGDVPELQMAISPVQSGSYAGTDDFQVSLPTVYNGYVSGTTNALLIGTPDPETENKFRFHHAAALIKVTYNNVPYGTTGLVLEANQNIASTDGISLSSTDDIIKSDNEALNSSTVQINLKSDVSEANQTLVFYVPVPVGSYKGLNIYLIDGSGNKIDRSEKKSTKSFTLARKEIFATPGITVDITIDPVTVGTDNTTEGLGANKSQKFKINQGKRLNLIFENFSAATSQPYYNWVVYNDQNDLYVRADKYAKDNTINWGQTSVGNFPASSSYNAADLNETTVIMTIDYYESGAYILNAVAKKNNTTYDLQFQYTYSTKPEEINIQLYTDHSHFVMKDAWLEDAPVIKEVVGIEATADMIVYGESPYVCLSKEALKVKKVYSDGTKESVGYGEFSVSYILNTDYSAVNDTHFTHLGLASSNNVLAKVSYGGYNAFCDISITKREQIQTTRVGNESNTSPWRTDSESTWTVSPGTSVTLGMNLYSAQAQIYQSPSVLLMKNDNTEFGFVRIDNNGWDYNSYSIVTSRLATDYSSFIWAFGLNNSQVFITIANHEDGIASVTYYHKSNSNNNYSISHYNMNVGQEDLKFKISIEGASVVML